jgi:hypothetical protein
MAGTNVTAQLFAQDKDSSLRAPVQVAEAIRSASASTQVGFKYLLASAAQESGFRADAEAKGSSAAGLFQFTATTWLQMVRDNGAKYGLGHEARQISTDPGGKVRVADPKVRDHILALRKDPKIASAMAAEYARTNRDYLERKLGAPVGDTAVYLAHFLGPAGAAKLLAELRDHPNKPAADVVPYAAAANPTVFTDRATGARRSVAQVYDWAYRRIDKRATALAQANALPVTQANTPPVDSVTVKAPAVAAHPVAPVRAKPGAIFTARQVAPEAFLAMAKLDLFTWRARKSVARG